MKSYPPSQQVLEDLGDKVVEAISRSVDLTRSDLTAYRQANPLWVAQASERGLAAWIHDRLWYHFSVLVDGIEDLHLVDKEPTREACIGVAYRLRMKRHQEDGRVSTYPTQAALEFMAQDAQVVIDGLEEVRLIAGYDWNRDAHDIGPAVLSLRDGKENIIWRETLPPATGGEGEGGVPLPEAPSPTRPIVDASTIKVDEDEQDVTE